MVAQHHIGSQQRMPRKLPEGLLLIFQCSQVPGLCAALKPFEGLCTKELLSKQIAEILIAS